MGKKFWVSIFVILLIGFTVGYFSDKLFTSNKMSLNNGNDVENQIKKKFEEKKAINSNPFIKTPILVTDRRNEKMVLSEEEQMPIVDVVKEWVFLKYNVDYETLTQEQFNKELTLFTKNVQESVQLSEYEKIFKDLQDTKYRSFLEGFQIKSIQFSLEQDTPVYLVTVLADVYQAQNESLASLTYKIEIKVDQKEKKIREAEIVQTDFR